MVALTHYIEARVLPLDGASPSRGDAAHVLSLLMSAIHQYILQGNNVAVGFPSKAIVNQTDGDNVVRVFGDPNVLMGLFVQQSFAALVGGGAIHLGQQPIRQVPQDVTWVSYTRNRSAEKSSVGWAIRSDRRFRARTGDGNRADERLQKLSERPVKKRTPFFVNIGSSTTAQRFRLFVDETSSTGPGEARFNNYGLALPGSAVPAF